MRRTVTSAFSLTGAGFICAAWVSITGAEHLQADRQPEFAATALPAPVQLQSLNASQNTPAPDVPFVNRYCTSCHNDRSRTGGLTLEHLDTQRVGDHPDVWEKVVLKLRSGAMPPAGARRPDQAVIDTFASSLEEDLDRAAAANPPTGRLVVQRLNRREYANAIRDLLALEIDVAALLPADESGYGFDNIADVLSVTPALLERYMVAAQRVSRLAVGDLRMRPVAERYVVSAYLPQDERVSDQLSALSRGGSALRHHFPLDGEYVLRVRLRRGQNNGGIEGLDTREQVDIRLEGSRLKLISIGGECVNSSEPRCVSLATNNRGVSEYEQTADRALEVRFSVEAGTKSIGVAFVKANTAREGAGPARQPQGQSSRMSVASIEVEGPITVSGPGDTPSRRKIFVCHPTGPADEASCAKTILSTLARRAYRRPVTDQEVVPLLDLYQIGAREGGFEAGIQLGIEALLASPHFLLRVEGVRPAGPVRAVSSSTTTQLTDFELASRLSFFLWRSIPDDELLEVAGRGQLRNPSVVEQQVRRMLADSRAKSLVSDFASQWLHLRNLERVQPDYQIFPDWDENLRAAFERETEMFLESQLRDDRSVVELLTADYTFLNERLARFYGISNVYGEHFRRVTMTDPNRRGLLGHGSILTVTSYSTRTSPVVRGKWILENLLGSPPPPPPPNVEALAEANKPGEAPKSMRERMEAHRANATCASCHSRMDPMGFALENFMAIGKWRSTDGGAVIDTSGKLPDGTAFTNPVEFHQVLLEKRDEYLRTLTEKLLTYALGRGVEFHDMPAVRGIVRNAADENHRWSAILLEIVKSAPFQRTAPAGREAEAVRSAN